jgi:hypothetical protein
MGDLLVASGDWVEFEPLFGNRVLMVPATAVLMGTGRFMVAGKPGCVISDLNKVVVPGISYTSGIFTVPGLGTVQLVVAGPDQTAHTVLSGLPVLLKGSQCQAIFTPSNSAKDPSTGLLDPTLGVSTPGKGRFNVFQNKVTAN